MISRRRYCVTRLLASAVAVAACASARPAFASGPTMSECLAANESAIKLRADHKLRQSRAASLVCGSPTCPRAVRDACGQRAAQEASAIPTVVFEARDASGSDVTNVAVAMDGEVLATHLDGTAIAVDPGDHTLSFTVPGQPSIEKHFLFFEGVVERHESFFLATALAPALAPAPSALSSPSSSGLGTRRLVGLGLGGVGVAGVAVGSIFGALTYSSWSSAGSACGSGGTAHCSRASSASVLSDRSAAVTDGTISTVAFVAGGVLVASGLAVFLTGGHDESVGRPAIAVLPTLGPGHAGLSLGGGF